MCCADLICISLRSLKRDNLNRESSLSRELLSFALGCGLWWFVLGRLSKYFRGTYSSHSNFTSTSPTNHSKQKIVVSTDKFVKMTVNFILVAICSLSDCLLGVHDMCVSIGTHLYIQSSQGNKTHYFTPDGIYSRQKETNLSVQTFIAYLYS